MPLAFIRLLDGPDGPVDPGFGGGIGADRPDNSLPGGLPPIGVNLPAPPPGIWPPPTASHPIVPAPPGSVPPGTIWPSPGVPTHPIAPPGGGHPDQGLPPMPDQGLPGGSPGVPTHPIASQTFWVVAGIPGIGWRYVAVDPSLKPGMPLPPTPEPK